MQQAPPRPHRPFVTVFFLFPRVDWGAPEGLWAVKTFLLLLKLRLFAQVEEYALN